MPMGMIGADTDELRAVAMRFAQRADDVEASRSRTTSVVRGVDWVGPDRDDFVENWGRVDGGLRDLNDVLDRVGLADLPAQADAQDEASAGRSGGSWPGAMHVHEDGERRLSLGDLRDLWYSHRTDVDDEDRHRDYDHEIATHPAHIDPYEVRQGSIGNCWALASLAAVAQADPEFLSEHVRYNEADQSYTVTLYDEDGNPVDVTVDSSFVEGRDGEGWFGATDSKGYPNYASIYEKALAEHFGGDYGDIDGGRAVDGLQAITGQTAESHAIDSPEASADQIRANLENGEAVTLSTKMHMWGNQPIVEAHVYTVTDVRPNGDVVMYNPWGENPESGYTDDPTLKEGEIVVPAEDLEKYFSSVETTT